MIDGRDGKFGSEVVWRGGNATLVGMFTWMLGSEGSISLGSEGCGKFGMDGIFGPIVGFGNIGDGGSVDGLGSDGIGGKFGIVCKRCRVVRPASTLENVQTIIKTMMK
ncbi:unnamed protein product [Citrullus colocynthis]|uniref:Uncharacterized protein n=1 Tax=Citrullus colocynthis TaxID=252529 RepID=A0ABP0YR87_9ROSI